MSSTPTSASSTSAGSTGRSSTRRARASACSRAAPTCAGASQPLPELQLELLRAAAERTKPGGTIVYAVCTLNADENEAVVDALGLEVEPLGAEWPQYAHPSRPEFLLTRPDRDRTSGFFIARLAYHPLMPWSDWIRTVRGRAVALRADFSRLGEQMDALLDAGCRVFHFDVGDGHFVEPITIGPIVLQWISPASTTATGRSTSI